MFLENIAFHKKSKRKIFLTYVTCDNLAIRERYIGRMQAQGHSNQNQARSVKMPRGRHSTQRLTEDQDSFPFLVIVCPCWTFTIIGTVERVNPKPGHIQLEDKLPEKILIHDKTIEGARRQKTPMLTRTGTIRNKDKHQLAPQLKYE